MEIRDRVVELRRVRGRELVPNPKNWRIHPKVQVKALRGMLGEIGNTDALLVRQLPDGRLMLLDGHLRSDLMPNEEVPVLVVDLSEEEGNKLLATLDPLAGMAVADSERLDALLESFRTDNPSVLALLDDIRAREGLLLEDVNQLADPEARTDKADELREKWDTAPGQLWQIGPHRLACGDSRDPTIVERLWQGRPGKFRMIWCDPPYGVDYAAKNRFLNRSDRGNRIQKPIANDALDADAVSELFQGSLERAQRFAIKGAACYAAVPSGALLPRFIAAFNASGFSFKHLLVWFKHHFVIGLSDYQQAHEVVLYGWREDGAHYFTADRTQRSVFEVDKPRLSDLHPTTKPIKLIARMIANSSRPGELIYDPFAGSGSTVVAAAQLKRQGYGCELDPAYLAVGLERLAALGLQPELRQL